MRQVTVRLGSVVAGLGLVVALCSGCGSSTAGGGGGGGGQPAEVGSLRVSVAWPDGAARLVPSASASVRVEVVQAGATVAQAVINRPATTALLEPLALGAATVRASAHPAADAQGVAQAVGAVDVTIFAGENTHQLTMVSAIASFVIAPAESNLAVGAALDLTATAYDDAGAVVLLPDAAAWSVATGAECLSLAASRAVNRYTATVAGTAAGEATVQVSFDEAPGVTRTATATVAVGNRLWSIATFQNPVDVRTDAAGNVFLGGGDEDQYPTLARFDANGSQQWRLTDPNWRKRYGGLAATATGDTYFAFSWGLPVPEANAFTYRYDPAGTQQGTWSLLTGGRLWYPSGVARDPSGNVIIAGSGGFWADPATHDAFLVKCDANLAQTWLLEFGTPANDVVNGVAVDAAGNSYLTGQTAGDLGGPSLGGTDFFLAKYDAFGNQVWLRQFGTAANDSADSVAVNAAGQVYVTGQTAGDFGGPNAGGDDAFLAQYDAGGTLLWVRQFGFAGDDRGHDVAVDAVGNVYATGQTSGALAGAPRGGGDVFLMVYAATGNELWSRQFGTTADDRGRGVTVDGTNHVYVCGTQGQQGFLTRFAPLSGGLTVGVGRR